jgi:sugar lactone lactonase YvrE
MQLLPSSTVDNTNRKWTPNGITVAGGNGEGDQLNQLNYPQAVYVDNDDDQMIYIVDRHNDRLVKWKQGENKGEIVAGGNQEGNEMNQLALPSAIIIDKSNYSFIICDWRNKRVVRRFYQNNMHQQIILENIDCSDVAMDNNKDLYVSDYRKLEVRRWREGQTQGTIVADGNGLGDKSNRIYLLISLFVDQNHSVYVSDTHNERVMKWIKDAKEAIVVAGGQGQGNNLTQLSSPSGLFVDQEGNIYVADQWNHRIMRWSKGSKEGSIIVGGNGQGQQPNQLNGPTSLSFDRQGNLYVADSGNHRVQKFNVVSD